MDAVVTTGQKKMRPHVLQKILSKLVHPVEISQVTNIKKKYCRIDNLFCFCSKSVKKAIDGIHASAVQK